MENFPKMDVDKINDKKVFWKTVKPRFSNKCKTARQIILTEGDTIIKNGKLIADTINNFLLTLQKL